MFVLIDGELTRLRFLSPHPSLLKWVTPPVHHLFQPISLLSVILTVFEKLATQPLDFTLIVRGRCLGRSGGCLSCRPNQWQRRLLLYWSEVSLNFSSFLCGCCWAHFISKARKRREDEGRERQEVMEAERYYDDLQHILVYNSTLI